MTNRLGSGKVGAGCILRRGNVVKHFVFVSTAVRYFMALPTNNKDWAEYEIRCVAKDGPVHLVGLDVANEFRIPVDYQGVELQKSKKDGEQVTALNHLDAIIAAYQNNDGLGPMLLAIREAKEWRGVRG